MSELDTLKNLQTQKDESIKYRSVSNLLTSIQVPFDREGKSLSTAQKRGMTQQEVLDEWDEKSRRSRERGTQFHEYVSRVLRGEDKDPILQVNPKTVMMLQFDSFWKRAGLQPVQVERKLYLQSLVGIPDALLYNPIEDSFHIFDWKSGEYKSRGWNRLLPPFSFLWDNSDGVNSIQLGLYRLMIETETGVELGASYTGHFSDETYHISKVKYYKSQLEEWLRVLDE